MTRGKYSGEIIFLRFPGFVYLRRRPALIKWKDKLGQQIKKADKKGFDFKLEALQAKLPHGII